MSTFEEGFRGASDGDLSNAEWLPSVRAMYPMLAMALVGEGDWERDASRRPPYTLMLSIRDGRLRITLSHPERPKMYHCGISNPSDILGSIESALSANQGEWSVRRQNGTSNRR